MKRGLLLFYVAAIVCFLSCHHVGSTGGDEHGEADRLHEACLTIDSHTDTPFWLLREGFSLAGNPDSMNFRNQVDFAKMKAGGLDAVFFAVFVGQGEMSTEWNSKAIARAKEEFEAIHQAVEKNNGLAAIGYEPEDAYVNEANGLRTVFIGIENGYAIGDSLPLLQEYHDKGARYVTLCHTRNNAICDSSTDPEGMLHNGLSDFGREVVKEMNRLGIMIDVSHISDKSFYDVLEVTEVPVVASHSDTRALCDNPRNLNDSMLLALKENGGVIQMCLLSDYVKELPSNPLRDSAMQALREKYPRFSELPEEEKKMAQQAWADINAKYPPNLATVSDLADHIDHVVQLIGIDHVGIGSDFDGGGRLLDCQDASEMKNITRELVRRGYGEEEIRKIWGGNLLRVFSEARNYARLQAGEV